jgi:hypothetical protein
MHSGAGDHDEPLDLDVVRCWRRGLRYRPFATHSEQQCWRSRTRCFGFWFRLRTTVWEQLYSGRVVSSLAVVVVVCSGGRAADRRIGFGFARVSWIRVWSCHG